MGELPRGGRIRWVAINIFVGDRAVPLWHRCDTAARCACWLPQPERQTHRGKLMGGSYRSEVVQVRIGSYLREGSDARPLTVCIKRGIRVRILRRETTYALRRDTTTRIVLRRAPQCAQ